MSLLLDGVNQCAIHPATSGMFEGVGFGLAWRMKLDSVQANDEFLQRFASAVCGLKVSATTTGTLTVTIGAGVNLLSSITHTFSTGDWMHYFLSYDGGAVGSSNRMRMFINGQETSWNTLAVIPATIATPSSTRLYVGAITAGRAPTGEIADVMYWTHNINPVPDAILAQQFAHSKPLITHDTVANGPNLLLWFPYDQIGVTSSVGVAGTNYAPERAAGITGMSSNNLSTLLSSAGFGNGTDVGLGRNVMVF